MTKVIETTLTECNTKLVQYSVTERKTVIEGLEEIEYGIMQFTIENGEVKKLAEVRGVSGRIEDVVNLIAILSENEIEPEQLYEVVEDYITSIAMVYGCK